MKRWQTIGVALAVAAVAATALASTASATVPTWWECAKAPKMGKLYTGNYNDKLCSEPNAEGHGKYVLQPGAARDKVFKGKSKETTLHAKTWLGDSTVTCKGSKDAAIPETPNAEVSVEITLKGCEALGLKTEKCSSAGRKTGEVRFHAMRGELGYLSTEPVTVGLELWLESEPGGPIAEFKCGTNLEATVSGLLIGEVRGDVNDVSKPFEVQFAAAERLGTIEYEGHEFAPLVNLIGFAPELESIEHGEAPPHVLRAKLCGEYVKELVGAECAPEALAGLDQLQTAKGEALTVKA